MKKTSIILIAVLAAGAMYADSMQPVPVAEWNFDNQTLANDGSTAGFHDGVYVSGAVTNPVVGTAVFSTNTPSGSGYALDLSSVTDYMVIANSSTNYANYTNTFDSATQFTYSVWVRNPSGTWLGYGTMMGKGFENWNGDVSLKNGFELRAQNFTTAATGVRVEAWGSASVGDPSPYTDLTDTNWHLLTYTYDGSSSNLSLYIDGALKASKTSAVITPAPGRVLIFDSVEGDENAKQANCLYDSIQFYDQVLSASEVAELYIQQDWFTVTPDSLALSLTQPATLVTGIVTVAYMSATNVSVNVSFSNETHVGAFSVLETLPLVMTNTSPASTPIHIVFNANTAGAMTNGQVASCTAIVAWNKVGETNVTEVSVPLSLVYTILPEGLAGSVTSLGTTPTAVNPLNLSALGPMDWVMLGQGGNISNRNEKAGADYIGAVTVTGTHGAFSGNAYQSSWTNGAVLGAATNVQGSWEAQGTTTDTSLAFSLTGLAPAEYTMKVYCSKYKSTSQLTASKGSESYTIAFDQDGTTATRYGVFTVDFSIDTLGENLNVVYALVTSGKSSNVGLTAIALEQTSLSVDPAPGQISIPVISGGTNLVFSFGTTAGYQYAVEGTDNLVSGLWSNIVTDVAGTSGDVILTNAISSDAPQMFYRVYLQE
jgi:hypothetical protein